MAEPERRKAGRPAGRSRDDMTGEDLRRWRDARQWTQEQAAEWFGTTWRSWQRYEASSRKIPKPLMRRIQSERNIRREIAEEVAGLVITRYEDNPKKFGREIDGIRAAVDRILGASVTIGAIALAAVGLKR